MKNEDVSALLYEIADLLELKDQAGFRVRAYRDAARRIDGLHEDISAIAAAGKLQEIHGIGPSIAEKLTEFLETGHSSYRDELAGGLPQGISEILKIPGVGASKARLFYDKLHISTVDQLEEAAANHRLQEIPQSKSRPRRTSSRASTG